MITKVLIIGFGSIGARHGRILQAMGVDVACVTRNMDCHFNRIPSIEAALNDWKPTHVLIANATADHASSFEQLYKNGWRGPTLIEKPLFDRPVSKAYFKGSTVSVAFNLRFHPVIQVLRKRTQGMSFFSASLHVGQYLPDWRPGTDYRKSYSANRTMGGGVLHDLSHEIDLAAMLCGNFHRVAALGGKFSLLEIEADDVYHIMAEAMQCAAVSVELNYLNQPARRTACFNGDGKTWVVDLIAGNLVENGEVTSFPIERDVTYRAQLEAFLSGDSSEICSLEHGLHVDQIVRATLKANALKRWVKVT